MAKGIVSGESKRELIWSSHPQSDLNLYQLPGQSRLYPAPLPDELLTSWLCRIARINRSPLRTLLIAIREQNIGYLQGTSKKVFWNLDFDVECPSDLISNLSGITSVPQTQIGDLTLTRIAGQVNSELLVKYRTHILGGLRFCPQCLKSDVVPYYRKSWRLRFITMCPIHQICLLDRCPHCQRPLRITELRQNTSFCACYSCGFDFRTVSGEIVPDAVSVIKLQEDLIGIANRGLIDGIESKQYFDALHFLTRFIVLVYPLNSPFFEQRFAAIDSKRMEFLKQRNFIYEDIPISCFVIRKAQVILGEKHELEGFFSRNQTLFNYLTQKQCPNLLQPYRIAKEFNKLTEERIMFAVKEVQKKKKSLTYVNVAKEVKCDPTFYLSHPELRKIVDSSKEEQKKHLYERVNATLTEIRQKGESVTISKFAQLTDCPISKMHSDPHLHNLIFVKSYDCFKIGKGSKKITPEGIFQAISSLQGRGIQISLSILKDELNCSAKILNNKINSELIKPFLPQKKQSILQNSKNITTTKRRKSRINLTKEMIGNTISLMEDQGEKITYAGVARRLGVSNPVIRNNPEFNDLVMRSSEVKLKHKKTISLDIVQQAIMDIQKKHTKLTLKTMAEHIECNFWTLRDDPIISSVIKLAQDYKVKRNYDDITPEKVNEAIANITQSGKQISVNEVGRQLNCTKLVFRNKPDLKQLILEAKEGQVQELNAQFRENYYFNYPVGEFNRYLKIFEEYKKEMKEQGRDWHMCKNETTSKKLGIPLQIFLNFKLNECPNSKKRIKAELKDAFLNGDNLTISNETKLSPESQQYEAQFLKYIQEMDGKGKDWRASRNDSISKKLGVPPASCVELKQYFSIKRPSDYLNSNNTSDRQ